MTIFKLMMAAAALTFGAGAAHADPSRAPERDGGRGAPMAVVMTHAIETGAPASRATIFGHAVSVRPAATGRAQVWGHTLDR